MGRNCWEEGTIKIPTKAWKPLRDGLAKAYNERQVKLHALALQLHTLIEAWKKTAKRGTFTVRAALYALQQDSRHAHLFDQKTGDVQESVLRSLCGKLDTGWFDEKKLRKPQKADFAPAVPTKHKSYSAGAGDITIEHETCEIRWYVSENKNAVEDARDSYMGQVLFKLLGQVQWTRGSGGVLTGNDEYNRENRADGGGSNYITQKFGPKTAEEKAREARLRQSMSYSSGYGHRIGRY